ncbi:AraC-type DNA-binding protein [Spirosomataceae bacterium TFI 002]|nr:AraC-type DNA-binding protein [Spirosomataceae bacterium TFI 002]
MNNIAIPTFTLLAIVIALLLALFLLTLKTNRHLSNRLFATFLILTAVDISGLIKIPQTEFLQKLQVFRSMLIFLHLPIFYWYVKSVCYSDFKLRWASMKGLVPFAFVIGILIPIFFADDLKPSFFQFSNEQVFTIIIVLFHIQVAWYLWLIYRELKNFKTLAVNHFAGNHLQAYRWLMRLTAALAIFYLLALFKNIFKTTTYTELSEWLKIALLFFELAVLCWYLFQAISQPEVFRGIHSTLSLEKSNDSNIDSSKIKELEMLMKSEKLYLNPSISVKDVAEKIEIPVRDLSTLLNKHLGKHFFDFINEYRIKEAQEIFKSTDDSKLTVLEVLYNVGFNSKSSFNTAFKKHTGSTPTAFRKSL